MERVNTAVRTRVKRNYRYKGQLLLLTTAF